jgi:hypothetical protein
LNILTVKWGDKYDSSYVNTLYHTIGEKSTFYCYTDDPVGLDPDINVIDIDNELEGVWNKLSMFQKDFGGIKGKIIYLDLDVFLQREINPLYDSYDAFTMVKCYWKPLSELYNSEKYFIKTDMDINSSVMVWNQNENIHIWEHFMTDPERFMHKYLGIDRFIFWEELAPKHYFKPYLIYSRLFGIDANNGWYTVWAKPYYVKDAIICLMNGHTTKKDYVELQNDINNDISQVYT